MPIQDFDFHRIQVVTPTADDVASQYGQIEAELDAAADVEQSLAAIGRWDQLLRRLDSWDSLTGLRFEQDTRNPQYRQAREYRDQLRPKLTEHAVRLKRSLLQSPHRAPLEQRLGKQAFALWEVDVTTYEPVIEQDMVREAALQAEYTELLASAQLEFQGRQVNLPEIEKFREHPDRQVRHEAERKRWAWFDDNRPTLDGIFDQLVALRAAMATKLGFQNYIELGYKRMARIDYGRQDVERFRTAVRQQVTPFCQALRQQQADRLGVDRLMFWDEELHERGGNPAPLGGHDWMIQRAQEMFDEMGGQLKDFFRLMVSAHLMDLQTRAGKAGGGFCTSFASYGVPFIFANFNGTKGDVEVFTHEMGHAFQNYMSRDLALFDYTWPTCESCEIHSMSLEFLTWPFMEKFFGEAAQRFRQIHLTQSLLFLPYGVAVDHFQHLVYAQPDATPAQRHMMWQEMEQTYLPWRDYGDLPHTPQGGMWQKQRHIYLCPFYYIDYTLALTCALQFWVRSRQDFDHAMESYVALCKRGGQAAFQELVRCSGLISPFQEGGLTEVVAQARAELEA